MTTARGRPRASVGTNGGAAGAIGLGVTCNQVPKGARVAVEPCKLGELVIQEKLFETNGLEVVDQEAHAIHRVVRVAATLAEHRVEEGRHVTDVRGEVEEDGRRDERLSLLLLHVLHQRVQGAAALTVEVLVEATGPRRRRAHVDFAPAGRGH